MAEEEAAPMSARMKRFLAKPPRRLSEEAVGARRAKCVRRSKPRGILEELCEAQKWRCAYCSRSMRRKPRPDKPWLTATIDHVLPISRGGRNQRHNLAAACQGCNQAKGAMTREEFIAAGGPRPTLNGVRHD